MAQTLEDKYLRRAQTLMRIAEGEANEVAAIFDTVNRRIIRTIRNDYSEGMSRREYRKLETKIKRLIKQFYGTDFPEEITSLANQVVASEINWNITTLLGEGVAQIRSLPKNAAIVKRADRKTYQGHTFNYHVKKEYRAQSKRVTSLLRDGYVQSRSFRDIQRDIEEISKVPRSIIKTHVRSSFMHYASEAKSASLGINPDVIEGYIWTSVLDHRTTPLLCGIRDGLEYDSERNPVGHDIPWLDGPGRLHWNCRSIESPKVKGVSSVGRRAAVEPGSDYKRGDNKTRTGRVRHENKAARDKGIFAINERTTKSRYENWLKEQSRHNIDYAADVLGSKRNARLFRDGEVTLQDLALENPVARPLTRKSL